MNKGGSEQSGAALFLARNGCISPGQLLGPLGVRLVSAAAPFRPLDGRSNWHQGLPRPEPWRGRRVVAPHADAVGVGLARDVPQIRSVQVNLAGAPGTPGAGGASQQRHRERQSAMTRM